jgi:hypothetical protein
MGYSSVLLKKKEKGDAAGAFEKAQGGIWH